MSHSEKATSLCFLENHLTVRLDYEDIIRLESKQKSAKKNGRMYESFRKSYIIMLSRKLLSCEIWLWRHKLIRIQNQLKKKQLPHRMHESSKKRSIIMLSGKYRFLRLDNENKSCFELKKKIGKSLLYVWLIQKKQNHYAISETIDFWDLIMKTKVVCNQKTTAKFFIFITVCMRHPEKATTICCHANTRLLRLGYKNKICLKLENNDRKKFNFLHRINESFRKSYIIVLSRKLLKCKTWLWRYILFGIQNQLKKI